MQLIIFILQALSFTVLFLYLFYKNDFDFIFEHLNIITYQKNLLTLIKNFFQSSIPIIILSVFGLQVECYENKLLVLGISLLSIICGYVIYKILLSKINDKITHDRAFIPDSYLTFWDALASIGIDKKDVSEYETFPLVHGQLTTFIYKGRKLYCESYKDDIVHSIYYFDSETLKARANFLFWDCMGHTDISDWKEYTK